MLGGVNYIIDPLKYSHLTPGTREITGLEQSHKIWQARMRQPETLVLGNSRTLYGFDVSRLKADKPFNYSFPGPSIEEVTKQFENVLYATPAQTIYLVVDDICSAGSSSRELSALFNNDADWLKAEFMRAKYLISLDTLKASVKALGKPIFYDDFGQRISFVFSKQSGETLSERVKIREGYTLKSKSNGNECKTDVFAQLLTKIHASHLDVSLILNPVHIRYLYIAAQKNTLSGRDVNLKNLLVSVNANIAHKLDKSPLPIFDFNLINSYTTEPFDLINNNEPIYWWESSHYKKALGDKMVDWLNAPEQERDTSIGVSLSTQNIQQHNNQQRQKLLEWRDSNPVIRHEINALVQSANNAH